MPIFEYRCLKCQSRFEKLLKSAEEAGVACPQCGSEQVEKIMSAFSAVASAATGCSSGG